MGPNCRARKHPATDLAEESRAPPAAAPRRARQRQAEKARDGKSFVRPPSGFFSGCSIASRFGRQLRQQGDRRGAGTDQKTLALELDHGDKTAVAESRGFAHGERLMLASRAADYGPPEKLETGGGDRIKARRVGPHVCSRDFHLR